MDEFALLPHLAHMSNGVNFGRSLGLKFLVGAQNVAQVRSAYGEDNAESILSGFGTVPAFRLMDSASRGYFSDRFGANRKRRHVHQAVFNQGVRTEEVEARVVEDWHTAGLSVGQALVALPTGPPFRFELDLFTAERKKT